jgi:hypothetical protein
MKRENKIDDEMKKIDSSLAGLPTNMPYGPPENYFENFAVNIQKIIIDINAPDTVADFGKALPYTVPAGYFEGLTDKIVATSAASVITMELPGSMPYTTPVGYFDALPGAMLTAARTADNGGQKTIPLKHTMILPKRWAAAAIILLTIGLGSFEFFSPSSANSDKILASVSPNEIQDYLQPINGDLMVSGNPLMNLSLDNNEIIEYFNESGWN